MSFDQRNNKNIENDDLNIKSHLNTSLEKDQISVSEDLINRTLAAIRQQPAVKEDIEVEKQENTGKVIPLNRYIRGFAGAAAAMLILFAGFQALQMMESKGSKNEIQYKADSAENTEMDTAAPESASEDEKTVQFAADDAVDSGYGATGESQYAALESKTLVGAAASEEASQAPMETTVIDEDTKDKSEERVVTGTYEQPMLRFTELFPIPLAETVSIRIKNVPTQEELELNDASAIREFYSRMESHLFTVTTEAVDHSDYLIEITGKDAVIKLNVGTNMSVEYQTGDVASYSVYKAEDLQKLLEELRNQIN